MRRLPRETAHIYVSKARDGGSVNVDGFSSPLDVLMLGESLSSAVDQALTMVGFRRVGEIVAGAIADFECEAVNTGNPAEPADWRDHPTMVRITDDDTASMLNDMSARLGIPADELATTWIRNAATDALYRYERFMSPGYIADHNRIVGWIFDGSPRLKG